MNVNGEPYSNAVTVLELGKVGQNDGTSSLHADFYLYRYENENGRKRCGSIIHFLSLRANVHAMVRSLPRVVHKKRQVVS